ncbi:SpaH/EbpB family LPXTG-anchored major pilin [Corynebacterium nasicanis]|uniref:SpaH/EbpB family LPXTG-anchored major pilin n=1 Tax=Corynebacterium nasicanis TaxID=1448267 RepID=A0ABW1QE72_9CORY
MNTLAQRSASVLAVAGLSLGLVALGAPGALAADPEPAAATAPASLVDFAASGSITVVKSTDAQAATHDTGNAGHYTPENPLAGVTFELFRVMEIKNAADFQTAAGYTVATAPAGTSLGARTTGADGTVSWDSLPVGLYLVKETAAPEGVSKAADYLVYLPMTNPADTTRWNYDVVTYPKNSRSETTKTVDDADRNVGDEIAYTITSDIPVVTQNNVTKYEVHDQLDGENLATSPEQVSVVVAGQTLVPGVDYTVTVSAEQKVEVVFQAAGLTKLTEAKKADVAAKVVTTIKATVKAIGATDGVATNQATVFHNNPYNTNETDERPSGEVTTYWAKLRVLKQGAADKALEGAEFELYRCASKAELGQKVSIGAVSTWTTGADGTLVIDGLHVTDVENSTQLIDKTYCLVEVKAPAGYELLTEPVEVKLAQADRTRLGDDAFAVSVEKTIQNIPSNQPKLPLTGGMGIGIFAGLAAALVAVGSWLAKRQPRA